MLYKLRRDLLLCSFAEIVYSFWTEGFLNGKWDFTNSKCTWLLKHIKNINKDRKETRSYLKCMMVAPYSLIFHIVNYEFVRRMFFSTKMMQMAWIRLHITSRPDLVNNNRSLMYFNKQMHPHSSQWGLPHHEALHIMTCLITIVLIYSSGNMKVI